MRLLFDASNKRKVAVKIMNERSANSLKDCQSRGLADVDNPNQTKKLAQFPRG
jgi:hypothetical protein